MKLKTVTVITQIRLNENTQHVPEKVLEQYMTLDCEHISEGVFDHFLKEQTDKLLKQAKPQIAKAGYEF